MTTEFTMRPESETTAEREFLRRRLEAVERDMGRLAARFGAPTPATPQMDVLDRARDLLSDLLRQVRVRPLDEALTARLEWLDRAQARRDREDDPEPKPVLDRIALDRRVLSDLRHSWDARSR